MENCLASPEEASPTSTDIYHYIPPREETFTAASTEVHHQSPDHRNVVELADIHSEKIPDKQTGAVFKQASIQMERKEKVTMFTEATYL